MRVFVDENIPVMTAQWLSESGHEVLDIRGTDREGMKDEAVWEMVQRGGYLMITTDKGFARYRSERHHGVLIVRLHQPNRQKIHNRVVRAMTRFSTSQWPGLLVVVRDRTLSVWKSKQKAR